MGITNNHYLTLRDTLTFSVVFQQRYDIIMVFTCRDLSSTLAQEGAIAVVSHDCVHSTKVFLEHQTQCRLRILTVVYITLYVCVIMIVFLTNDTDDLLPKRTANAMCSK